MAFKHKPFIVVTLGDRDSYGFDEQTLPLLVALMDSASPDYRRWHHASVTGYFVASARAMQQVERVIERAEELRRSDVRFQSLGIGVSGGRLLAEFSWLGRVNTSGIQPVGIAAKEASRLVSASPDAYHSSLDALRAEYRKV